VVVERSAKEADLIEIMRLIERAREHDHHSPLGEHKWLDLAHRRRTGYAGFVARSKDEASLAGYAHLSRGPESWGLEVVVDPARREPSLGIRRRLLDAAIAEVAEHGGGRLYFWVAKPTALDDADAASCGMRRGRDLYQMRRALPLEVPGSTLATRPFRPGEDEEAWLELNNRAFASHPEQGGWDLATLEEREQEPWFDPQGFLVYEVEGQMAGSCWTKLHSDHDPVLGEIYVIGVEPRFRGRGLGRALVVAGLSYLASQGAPVAMLYVDAGNQAAMRLYRSLGFVVDHLDRAYVADLVPPEA
jgi:mycothiol synthase